MKTFLTRLITHGLALAIGFMAGMYTLPILIAPASPEPTMLSEKAEGAMFNAEFSQDLRGNDFLHWGEGMVSLTPDSIVHTGKLAPGPDYKLYLVKTFVEHEDDFLPIKDDAKLIGDIKTFNGFMVNVPDGVNIEEYNTVLVWCESFKQFIAAAKYQ